MNRGYTPKTARGRIPSVPGGGRPVKVSRSIALPGIKGRWFNASIRKKHAETFPKLMRKYVKEGFQVVFKR